MRSDGLECSQLKMSSFFTLPSSERKRKRTDAPPGKPQKKRETTTSERPAANGHRRPKPTERDESISGSDSESSGESVQQEDESLTSEDEGETDAERRLRIAQRYLESIKESVDPAGFDAADIDRDLIAERLKEDVAESKGKIYRLIASQLSFQTAQSTSFRADQFGVTAVAVASPYAYTVSKDMTICKWELADPATQNKPHLSNISPRRKPKLLKTFSSSRHRSKRSKIPAHTAPILCAAVSSSGKFLATGSEDKTIIIWDAHKLKPLKQFRQHRDTIHALSFRRNTHTLYSASADRTIKIWSLDELTYVETLFGHEDKIVDIVGLATEKCISVGARDRSARLWKVIEESQLVFRGGGNGTKTEDGTVYVEGSIDRVAMLDEDMFVTGSDNGNICLWSTLRKKPVFTVPLAHGADPPTEPDFESGETERSHGGPRARWITALTTVPYSNLILSGSWDGWIRAWKLSDDKRRIEKVGVVGNINTSSLETNGVLTILGGLQDHIEAEQVKSVRGVINSLAVFERGNRGNDGVCIVAAVSKEHRLGKWLRVPKGSCGGMVFEVAKIESSLALR